MWSTFERTNYSICSRRYQHRENWTCNYLYVHLDSNLSGVFNRWTSQKTFIRSSEEFYWPQFTLLVVACRYLIDTSVRFSFFLRFNSMQQKIVWIIIGHGRWKNYSLPIKCSNCSLNGNVISRDKIGSLVLNRLICLVRLYWGYWSKMIGIEILDGVIIAFLL